ncbi:MAG: S8 family serine peptidase [Pseudomonadota bacterium]|nr:S8 family serine peptidase [Pseudomonadota bacterium]
MPKTPDGGPAGPPDSAATTPGSNAQQDSGRTAPRASSSTSPRGAQGDPGGASDATTDARQQQVGGRKKQFLVAPRQQSGGLHALGFQPLQFDAIEQTLRAHPDIEVLGTVGPRNVVGAFATGLGGFGGADAAQGVLVARMSEQKASALYQQGQGQVLVERDQHLAMLDVGLRLPGMVTSVMPAAGAALDTTVLVLGKDGAPLADAEVSLFGSLLPATAVTDASGQARLTLFGETPHTISGLYVKAKSDYWTFYQRDPDISTSDMNVVSMRALSDWPQLAGFPQQKAYGWGQKAMRLDQLPNIYRGQGIKVAVIDSGVATTHQNLNRVGAGFDIIHKASSPNTWNEDTLGHGSHCTAVIAGSDIATGLRGFAPDAEVHACKLFPGGQISQLIDALEYCIEHQIDVVNLSLGGAEPSEALEQQIVRAKQAGIACIVAAGNSGGPVQYPASSPHVLAVAAIGKLNEFPPDSYHTQTLTRSVDANGYFPASFSCHGPQVAICAPGVAITSAVPPNNFAAWDGTSMAAPHVTGLAALVLAHHPDFQSVFKTRGAERVERLFQIIKMSARRVSLGEQDRTGYGMPDVLVAIGLQAPLGRPVAQQQATGPTGMLGAMLGPNGGGQAQGALGSLLSTASLGQPNFGGHGSAFEPFASGPLTNATDPRAVYAGFLPGGQFAPVPGMQFGTSGFDRIFW